MTKFIPKFTKYITKKELNEYNNTDSITRKNELRNKIIQILASGFGSIVESNEFTWYFGGAEEGDIGELPDQLNPNDYFAIVIESINNRDYGRYITPDVKVKDIIKEETKAEDVKLLKLKEMLSKTLQSNQKKKTKPAGLGLDYCIKQIDKLLR